jgi:branched-chain amino acid transport system substrate-binding protein
LRRLFIVTVALAVITVLLSSCAEPVPPKGDAGRVITIGLILPLEGDYATFGQLCKNAIDLAVDQVNSSGGLLGMQIDAVPGNDGAGDVVAANAAEQFTQIQHVAAIVGPYTTQSSLAAASVCQANRTPMIAIRASEPQVTAAGSYIFRACYVDAYQGTLLGRFAAGDLKAGVAVAVYNQDDKSSSELINRFKKEIELGGGRLASVISYSESTKDFSKIAGKIAKEEPDVVLLPDFEDKAGMIIDNANRAGVKTVYLGTDLWDTEKLFKVAGKACLGSYVSRHFSPDDPNGRVKKFVSLYKDDYGVKPGPSAALAYDAINLTIEAIKKANSADPEKIRAALTETKNFRGVTGDFIFDENRNPLKGGAIVKIVEGGEKFEKRIEP